MSNGDIDDCRRRRGEARKQGRKGGRKGGRKEGRKEGRKDGRRRRRRRREEGGGKWEGLISSYFDSAVLIG